MHFRGEEAIHVEMKKQVFSIQVFAGPSLTTRHREEDFDPRGLV